VSWPIRFSLPVIQIATPSPQIRSSSASRAERMKRDADSKPHRSTPHLDPGESRFRLEVRRSHVHRWGIFALEAIPAHRQVIEYKGKRVSMRQFEREARKNYVAGKISRVSLFIFNREWGIDGDVDGNGAVIINHSCDPNLRVRRLRGHILYFSKRKIRSGEELLIDYRFPAESVRTPCRCGAKNCRGTINVLPKAKSRK
jgi:SET domain-containing protein